MAEEKLEKKMIGKLNEKITKDKEKLTVLVKEVKTSLVEAG